MSGCLFLVSVCVAELRRQGDYKVNLMKANATGHVDVEVERISHTTFDQNPTFILLIYTDITTFADW